MWARYRLWKNAITPPLVGLAAVTMKRAPENSAPWYLGLLLAVTLGLAYVVEEVVWNLKGRGRPCTHCGHRLAVKSFRVRHSCPGCGELL